MATIEESVLPDGQSNMATLELHQDHLQAQTEEQEYLLFAFLL